MRDYFLCWVDINFHWNPKVPLVRTARTIFISKIKWKQSMDVCQRLETTILYFSFLPLLCIIYLPSTNTHITYININNQSFGVLMQLSLISSSFIYQILLFHSDFIFFHTLNYLLQKQLTILKIFIQLFNKIVIYSCYSQPKHFLYFTRFSLLSAIQ